MNNEQLRLIYREAKGFLEQIVGKEALEERIAYIRSYKATSMNDLFRCLVTSVTNKHSMQKTIGAVEPLAPFFFGFDPVMTFQYYQHDWRRLFNEIKARHRPPGPMNITKRQSYWVLFCRASLSGAVFLANFDSFEVVNRFIAKFQDHDLTIPVLPLLLQQEVYGLGFALGCDFLRQAGFTNYSKPDRHVTDLLCGLEIVEDRSSYKVFRGVLRMARANDELPAVVDKVLFLIGNARKKRLFIEEMKAKLAMIQ